MDFIVVLCYVIEMLQLSACIDYIGFGVCIGIDSHKMFRSEKVVYLFVREVNVQGACLYMAKMILELLVLFKIWLIRSVSYS